MEWCRGEKPISASRALSRLHIASCCAAYESAEHATRCAERPAKLSDAAGASGASVRPYSLRGGLRAPAHTAKKTRRDACNNSRKCHQPSTTSRRRPSSGRRSPLVPIDDEETRRLEQAQGALIAQRLLERDRAAVAAAAATAGASGMDGARGEPVDAQLQHTPTGPGPGDTITRKVAALRAGGYLPTPHTPERDGRQVSTPDGGERDDNVGHKTTQSAANPDTDDVAFPASRQTPGNIDSTIAEPNRRQRRRTSLPI